MHVETAETPDLMAASIVELLADPERRAALGDHARQLVVRRYTWDACAATYGRLYAELALEGSPEAVGTATRVGAPR